LAVSIWDCVTGAGAISMLAVVFSLIGATLAVLNLVLDFDYIEQGVAMGAPASESWRGAFGPDRHHGLAVHRDLALCCLTYAGSPRIVAIRPIQRSLRAALPN
jgi:hypothetical protein